MEPFSLEAAKRGKPIVSFFGEAMNFIGVRSDGNIVCEIQGKHLLTYEQKDLRMAPKTRVVWVNFYPDGNRVGFYYDTPEEAAKCAAYDRIGGKAYPVEIEE